MTQEIVTTEPKDQFSAMVEMLGGAVIDPTMDRDKMMGLLDVQERMMKKAAEMAFNRARTLLKFPPIPHKSEIRHNGKLISKYTKYEDMDKIIRPIYEAEGFSISFNTKIVDSKTVICGKLCHVQGHFEEAEMQLPLDTGGAKSAIQSVASTLTYGKRYIVQMLLNVVCGGEDNDGSDAATVDTEQAAEIDTLLRETKSDVARFLKWIGAESVQEILAKDHEKALQMLNAKKVQK